MKVEILVPSPFPSWLAQDAPPEVQVEYEEFTERRGGLSDVNWIEVTIGIVAPWAIKVAWGYLLEFSKRFPIKIKTENGVVDLSYEAFERVLKEQAPDSPKDRD